MSDVALVSHALNGFQDRIASRGNEAVFEVTREALDKVGLERDDIDAVIGCDQDAFNGVTVSFGMKACAVGGYNKPSTRIQNGGVYAIAQARAKILAGKADCVVIASEDNVRFDEKTISNISQDPVYTRPIGQNYVQSHALIANHHLDTRDVTEEDYARATAKNYEAGAENPYAHRTKTPRIDDILDSDIVSWPIRESEICPISAGAGALVLTSAELANEVTDSPVWIEGAGLGSSRYEIRDMDSLLEMQSLRAARRKAYDQAGITDARTDIDLAQIFNPISSLELLGYEALDLCENGDGAQLLRDGVTEPDGDLPVNPFGGAVVTNPLNTGGLYRTAMAMEGLREDDEVLAMSDAQRAVVTGSDQMLGCRGQTDGVLVLGTEAS